MRMSKHNILESSDSSWKILVNATQRAALAEGHPKAQKKRSSLAVVKSYEEFVQELGRINRDNASAELPKCDNVSANCAEKNSVNNVEQTNTYVLGEWNSDNDNETSTDEDDGYTRKDENNNENYKQCKEKHQEGKKYEDTEGNGSWSETSSSFDGNDDDGAFSEDQGENDWESLSSCSEDLNFEEFLKKTKIPRDEDEDPATKYLPYTTLTDCMIREYYPEPESENRSSSNFRRKSKKIFDDDYNKAFRQHGKLKLEERVPLMQVIDVLEDVNKILKKGEITPNMERVLEYKQDYPFTEGYEEEILGWCPYIVYKIEKFVKKISAKQWPY